MEQITSRKTRIAELWQELQKAEMEDAVEEAGSVLGVVESGTKVKLGPTVFAPVAVNGITTKALIDAGSPATIIFFLKVLEC